MVNQGVMTTVSANFGNEEPIPVDSLPSLGLRGASDLDYQPSSLSSAESIPVTSLPSLGLRGASDLDYQPSSLSSSESIPVISLPSLGLRGASDLDYQPSSLSSSERILVTSLPSVGLRGASDLDYQPSSLSSLEKTSSSSSETAISYQFKRHQVLLSADHKYETLKVLGSGMYGTVIKCLRTAGHGGTVDKSDKENPLSSKAVAVKIFPSSEEYVGWGRSEVKILVKLKAAGADRYNCVSMLEAFQHDRHFCIAFDMLDVSLYEYVEKNLPLPLKHVRRITADILQALCKLKELGLVHTDLKPDNVMLVDQVNFRAKIIDFGLSGATEKMKNNPRVQARSYRAPEVLLHCLPYDEGIDMWSVGCILARMLMCRTLYPGLCDYDQLRYIVEAQGLPPKPMLDNSLRADEFFTMSEDGVRALKTPEASLFECERGENSCSKSHLVERPARDFNLNLAVEMHKPQDLKGEAKLMEELDRRQCGGLLQKMLELNPENRVKPEEALCHPFVNMSHFHRPGACDWVMESFRVMKTTLPLKTKKRMRHNPFAHVKRMRHDPFA